MRGFPFQERVYRAEVRNLILSERRGPVGAILYPAIIAGISVLFYLLYHGPANLHDISHYITSGVAMVRDHRNLVYPYSSMNPQGFDGAYGYFQENGRLLDVTKAYPSRLYSLLFGLLYLLTGTVRFYYAHMIALAAIVGANLLLYFISRRFFRGPTQILFICSVAFTPILYDVLYPSNDALGYLFSVLILWACLCSRLSPIAIGFLIGISAHFRSQLIFFIVIAPILLLYLQERGVWARTVVGIAAAGIVSYALMGLLIGAVSGIATVSGGLDYYVGNFLQSTYGPNELNVVFKRLSKNLLDLGRAHLLFLYFFTAIFGLLRSNASLQRGLLLAGLLYVAIPLIIYSLDRTSDPHARYYAGAIPFLALAWFLMIRERREAGGAIGASGAEFVTAFIVVSTWLVSYGVPYNNVVSKDIIDNRLSFLDFKGAEKLLSDSFTPDDLIITNHALPSALAKLKYFIPYPSFSQFRAGDNREVDGIIFVYADDVVNRFFKPTDWFQNGELPREISDDSGTTFHQIGNIKSRFLGPDGGVQSEASLVIYKNSEQHWKRFRDASGRRIFRTQYHEDLRILRTSSPKFDDPRVWKGMMSRVGDSDAGVLVGPGPNNQNVLYQPFRVEPNEMVRIYARAQSGRPGYSKGRLQVNWLDADNRFIKASIAVFTVGSSEEEFRNSVKVPANAAWGILYVTPDKRNDVIKYVEAGVLGRGLDD